MQRIIFRIDQDGNVTEEVQGVTNDTCIDITKEIEDTLGNVKSRAVSYTHLTLPTIYSV